MSFRIRAAQADDLEHIYQMAKLTGGGFTNLPPDRDALTEKLAHSARAFANDANELTDETFVLVLENTETHEVRGTCQLFTQVGQRWPFYSYRLNTISQHSQELNRTVRAELLSLVTDLEGCSEVGGLFLHPNERAGGLGLLLARSRYLFITMHRRGNKQRRTSLTTIKHNLFQHLDILILKCIGYKNFFIRHISRLWPCGFYRLTNGQNHPDNMVFRKLD